MGIIKNPSILLKEKLDQQDYIEINDLRRLCLEIDKTSLKLELDYKLTRSTERIEDLKEINEFMYYSEGALIGYIGICHFGGNNLEVNGMVHPDYRRRGVFSKLFSLVKDEGGKRKDKNMLLLCDNKSISGQEFIRGTKAIHEHSEYEMFLKRDTSLEILPRNLVLRRATNVDAKEIAWQNSIYFGKELKEEDVLMPEEEEKHGTSIFLAEVDNKIVGKVHLEVRDGIGGIYGLGIIPQFRSKGLGRELLMAGVRELKERKASEIMLQVVVKNSNALNLYKSCGFQEASTMDYYELNK